MKKITALIFILLLYLCFPFQNQAQSRGKTEVKEIDSYCKKVDAFTERYKNPHIVFADTADYTENSKSNWKKFASVNKLEKFREQTETFSIAYNWRQNSKIVRSNFTLFSPSGDWAKYVHLYFRQDGTLAKAESELRTFYGNFIVLNDIYFNTQGKVLKKTVKYLDLKTEKPKKLNADDMENNGDNLKFTEYYKKTDKLPFAHLLKRRKS